MALFVDIGTVMPQNEFNFAQMTLSGTASSRESGRQSDRFHVRGRLIQYVRG
jgi:hypothetical protein